MNFRGIEMLREYRLPGPRREQLLNSFPDSSRVDLDMLGGSITIMAFDKREPVMQHPFFEKNVRKYGVRRSDFDLYALSLEDAMHQKGVPREEISWVVHESYFPDDIKYSGRVARTTLNGFGAVVIEGVEGLRKGKEDFHPTYRVEYSYVGGRLQIRSRQEQNNGITLPVGLEIKLMQAIKRIPGCPCIDWEVYSNGRIFFHDMFLEGWKV